MYRGGRPNSTARRANGINARLAATGLFGWWQIRLDTVNPVTGTRLAVPLVTTHLDGRRYLVSMLGQRSKWVRNVRASNGRAVITKGAHISVELREVATGLRAPILRSYLTRAPGARPHIPVSRHAPAAMFERIAADYPVFEIHVVSRRG